VRLLFADQLGPHFTHDLAADEQVLLIEWRSSFAKRRIHRQKAHLFLSAMRHLAAELGDRAIVVQADTFSDAFRQANIDPTLIDGLSRAHNIINQVGGRPDRASATNRKARAPKSAYQRALCTLAFLAPDIQAAIVAGRQPAGLKLEHLLRTEIPIAWIDQRIKFGF
jgi:hypothetical protein